MKVTIGANDIIPSGEYELTSHVKLENAKGNLPFGPTDRQILMEYDRIAGQVKHDGEILPPQSLYNREVQKPIEQYSDEELLAAIRRAENTNVPGSQYQGAQNEWNIRQQTIPKETTPKKHKKSYPRDYSNEELEELVDKYGDLNVEKFNIGPSYFTKAALGLTELERRSAARLGWWSFGTSLLALVLSGIAVWFAFQALSDDKTWRTDEINLLHQIDNDIMLKSK